MDLYWAALQLSKTTYRAPNIDSIVKIYARILEPAYSTDEGKDTKGNSVPKPETHRLEVEPIFLVGKNGIC